jgi:ribosome-associated protein
MSRKPTKGYYVKGHFVAQGSELDLALQREVKGDDLVSKTDLKQKSNELQKLGEDLLDLRTDLMQQLLALGHLPDLLHEAVLSAKKITDFEGKRRQMQYVGKLMRKLDSTQVEAMRDALSAQHSGSGADAPCDRRPQPAARRRGRRPARRWRGLAKRVSAFARKKRSARERVRTEDE